MQHSAQFQRQHRRALKRLKRHGKRKVSPEEMRRWLRLGELRRLLTDRYGRYLPNDDAGLEDLRELFRVISLGSGDVLTAMIKEAARRAPWLDPYKAQDEAMAIFATPLKRRFDRADTIGKRMRLS